MWGELISSIGSNIPWGDVIKGGVSMIGANQAKQGSGRALQQASPVGYGTTGPMGGTVVDPRTRQVTLNPAANPFYAMLQSLGASSFANAATAPGSYLYGADPELAAAYQGLTPTGMEAASQDRYNILTQLAQPEQNRAWQGLQDTLFGQGRLGTSGGGIQQEAFQNAANRADLERQMAAQDWAAQRAQSRFGGALQAVGSGQQGQFQGWQIGKESMGGMNDLFSNLLRQATLGLQAGSYGAMPGEMAKWGAEQQQAPWQAAYGALEQGGAFDWLNKRLQPTPPLPDPGAVLNPGQIQPPVINPGQLNLPQPVFTHF